MVVNELPDYGEYAEAPQSDVSLADITEEANRLDALDVEIKQAEEALAILKKKQSDIAERSLPEMMGSVGLDSIRTSAGRVVTIKETVHVHVSKAQHAAAMAWLDEHGHSHLAKRKVVVQFNKDQETEATQLKGELDDKYPAVAQEVGVHSSTLKAWATEMLKNGDEVPKDLFGLHVKKTAQIS